MVSLNIATFLKEMLVVLRTHNIKTFRILCKGLRDKYITKDERVTLRNIEKFRHFFKKLIDERTIEMK